MTVIFTRDLVRHGNVTLNVTYPISGSSADSAIEPTAYIFETDIFFVSMSFAFIIPYFRFAA